MLLNVFQSNRIIIKPTLIIYFFLLYSSVNGNSITKVTGTSNMLNIRLIIAEEHFEVLKKNRETALVLGQLIPEFRDNVPAKIIFEDKIYEASIRLKGDLKDHWKDLNTISFRVKVKKGTILGMKTFSLQHPKRRVFLNEWIYHRALAHFGLISSKYEFINFALNGQDYGIYVIEEYTEKYLIERNQHRAGMVMKIDDDYFWKLRMSNTKAPALESLSVTTIKPFGKKKLLKDDGLKKQYIVGSQLLYGFLHRKFTTSEVFNIEKLALLMVLSADIFGRDHCLRITNTRFFYNPITSKLEMLGFDAGFLAKRKKLFGQRYNYSYNDFFYKESGNVHWLTTFFKDRTLFKEYVKALQQFSDKKKLDDFFKTLEPELNGYVKLFKKHFPKYRFKKNILYANQALIKKELSNGFGSEKQPITEFPGKKLFQTGLKWQRKGAKGYFYDYNSSNDILTLKVGNYSSKPISITKCTINSELVLKPEKQQKLTARIPYDFINYKAISFKLPQQFVWSDKLIDKLKISYSVKGDDKKYSFKVLPFPVFEENTFKDDLFRQKPNYNQFSFLKVDEEQKTITFKSGQHELKEHLIIPPNYTLIINKETTITLKNSHLISYSPVQFIGSKRKKVIIKSTQEENSGGVFILQTNGASSVLKHVNFLGLGRPKTTYWELTGAVTFYEAPVLLTDCQFSNNQSEDALNIVRSNFEMNNCIIQNTFSDAFDADFCDGKIINSNFLNCRNDAIDVSGSTINIQNVVIKEIGDKGISSGENSKVKAKNVTIQKATIGVAAKDLSSLIINDVIIENSKIGIAGYQKKSEYGPSNIVITNLKQQSNNILHLVEKKSVLNLENQKIIATTQNLYNFLYKPKKYSKLKKYINKYPTSKRHKLLDELFEKNKNTSDILSIDK